MSISFCSLLFLKCFYFEKEDKYINVKSKVLSIDKVMITDPIVLISVVSNPFCADFVWSGVGYFYVPLLRYLLGVPHPF